MPTFSDLPTEIVDIVLQYLLQYLYISLIYTHDRSFFDMMRASPGCQRTGERLFYDTDPSRWDANERRWRVLDLEDAECDLWVLEQYAEVRRCYHENDMLSWQAR